ncbi:hypothetical protein CTDIVETGP_2674 [Clostridium tyrobutyricum DIVETGP]|uniref:Uncharacterized protein n=1 Tax=Clostridium tyrobutyricum DIVETGP TaxID=1408889 RepID=W6NAL5_CLOTY|nr:hypothetical protein CTK_C24550 [Clostridium tyrobutyricum]CDL92604.1 hypothetical protein CTDIVETGP_2674 [Clostridium tyrobutyricum DIVETGP]
MTLIKFLFKNKIFIIMQNSINKIKLKINAIELVNKFV